MDIENTTKTNPLVHLAEAMGNPDGWIEAQEARGQAQVVTSQQLPAQGDWEALEALGFVRGEPVPGDDLFVNATIPEGWYKEATEHSMYSVIKDERGIERATVGYKAAFYDRWAQISVKNVAHDIVSNLVHSENELEAPDYWGVLTPSEKELTLATARAQLAQYKESAARMHGHEYWVKLVERSQEVADFINKLVLKRTSDGQ